MLGTISDILGILSFIMSIVLFVLSHSILKNASEQRKDYNTERFKIQAELIALRHSIWDDNLDTLKIRSELRQALYSYRNRYWFIAFPFRLFHIQRSLSYIKNPIKTHHKERLCNHIDYLIGTMDKKENIDHAK